MPRRTTPPLERLAVYLILTGVVLIAGLATGYVSRDTVLGLFTRAVNTVQGVDFGGKEYLLEWRGEQLLFRSVTGCVPTFYAVNENRVVQPPPSQWPEVQREALAENLAEGCKGKFAIRDQIMIFGYFDGAQQDWLVLHQPKKGVNAPDPENPNHWVDVWVAADWINLSVEKARSTPGIWNMDAWIGKTVDPATTLLMPKGASAPQTTGELPTAAVAQPTPLPTIVAAPAPEPPPVAQPAAAPEQGAAPVVAQETAPEPTVAPGPSEELTEPVPGQSLEATAPPPTVAPVRPTSMATLVPAGSMPEPVVVQRSIYTANNGATYSPECVKLKDRYKDKTDSAPIPTGDFVKLTRCLLQGTTS
jgi:hypothetical protein